MDLFELEQKRIGILQNIDAWTSNHRKLFYLYDFFELVLSTQNIAAISAFITEFLEDYSSLLLKTEPLFYHPKYYKNVLDQAVKINELKLDQVNLDLAESIEIFKAKYEELISTLNGIKNEGIENKISFPVLEISNNKHTPLGFLESLTVIIKKSNSDKFIIIPSNSTLEKKLENQIKISWSIAINYTKKYVKRKLSFHEVIIQFDKKAGIYTGDSLGIILTLTFIEQLLNYYNSDYIFYLNPKAALSGGISEDEIVTNLSNEITTKKTEIVFYSDSELFVIPKGDENIARSIYHELNKEFPKRKIVIEAVENLDDILNRRNIVEIKKQNIFKKTSKKLANNWQNVFLIAFLSIIVGFYVFRDWDNNPAILESTENTLFVKNKVGKILWTRKMGYDPSRNKSESYLSYYQKLIDVNNDGINEIILSNEDLSELENNPDKLRIVCYDNNKNELWSYKFRDKIATELGEMDATYNSILVDTLSFGNKKVLLCIATSLKSFSSAVYLLELKSGKRLPQTLWNSGFFTNGLVKDFDNNGKKDLFASFCNNGFEQIGILQIEIDKLSGQCPTTKRYGYKELPMAKLDSYILFPKTDYTHYINQRLEGSEIGSLVEAGEKGEIIIPITIEPNKSSLMYIYDYHKRDFEVIIGNGFRVLRDSLVVDGKLNPPLTDTDEYCNQLISQIKYWNGKEFVTK